VYITVTDVLTGYTNVTFGTTQAAQFKTLIANATNAPVAITSVVNTPAAAAGRRLLSSSVSVSFTVTTTTGAAATAILAILNAPFPVLANVTAAGLLSCTGIVNGVAVVSSSSVAPVAITGLPVTTVEVASSAALPLSASKMLSFVLAAVAALQMIV
jgi:hypothetical protein